MKRFRTVASALLTINHPPRVWWADVVDHHNSRRTRDRRSV